MRQCAEDCRRKCIAGYSDNYIAATSDLDCDFRALPSSDPHQILRPAHRTILRALHYLQTELLEGSESEDEADLVQGLKDFVADLRDEFPGVAEQLGWEFFTHATFTSS